MITRITQQKVIFRRRIVRVGRSDARHIVGGRGYLVLGRTETLSKETADLFEPASPAEMIYKLRVGSYAKPEYQVGRSLGQISRIGQPVTRGFRQ